MNNWKLSEREYSKAMTAKITIVFFIVLCLEAGIVLTLVPWVSPNMIGDWGENYFLLLAAQKTGLTSLPVIVGSGWVRGAVTGIGILNLGIAFWEMANFSQTVKLLESKSAAPEKIDSSKDVV